MRNELATLITKSCTGATVTEKETTIFVDEKSVKGTEFYTAYQSGLNAEAILECDPMEFEAAGVTVNGVTYLPTEVVYNGNRKVIIRTYKKSAGSMELTIGRGNR